MYYEHKVIVKLTVCTLQDNVRPEDVSKIFNSGAWDYEIEGTQLITPAEILAEVRADVLKRGSHSLPADRMDAVLCVLDDIKSRLDDWQETYEEAL